MSNMDNLSADEITKLAEAEYSQSSGTNDVQESTSQVSGTNDIDSSSKENAEEVENIKEEQEDKRNVDEKETKGEKNFKKILAEKNEYANKASELQKELEDLKFYKTNPDAERYKDMINKEIEENPNLNREKAYIIARGLGGISKINSNKLNLQGNTPDSIGNPKQRSDMSGDEVLQEARRLQSAGESFFG